MLEKLQTVLQHFRRRNSPSHYSCAASKKKNNHTAIQNSESGERQRGTSVQELLSSRKELYLTISFNEQVSMIQRPERVLEEQVGIFEDPHWSEGKKKGEVRDIKLKNGELFRIEGDSQK